MEFFLGIESRDACTLIVATITLIAIFSGYFKLVAHPTRKRLPPGSFGFPIIGESISFHRAFKHNKIGEWVQDHIGKYGPVFKTCIFGKKIIFLTGQAGNKFTLGSNSSSNGIIGYYPSHVAKLFGKNSLLVLSGSNHRILRSVITSHLDPVNLRKYVSRADLIIKQLILQELNNKDLIEMAPMVQKIVFNVGCSLLFGVSEGNEKDALFEDSTLVIKGISSIPINLPGTTFHQALQARSRLCKKLSDIMRRRREDVENGKLGHNENIVSCFLNLRDENGDRFTEEAIQDNIFSITFASFDSISSLLCNFIRKLVISSEIYDKVLEEQKEVLKASKEDGKLTWNEIQMMKYTWTVAQELMRLSPPASASFRFAARDTTFSSFDIPKEWLVGCATTPTHMDKSIFEDPKVFDPKRFESQSKSSIPPYTYIPFGAGLKICPGAEYARFVVLLIIHHLVTNYSLTEMISDEPIICNPMPYPAMGLPVKLHVTQVNLE